MGLITQNLTKRYDELTAVDSLNIEVEAGEIFGLLGPNGAGKTTTLSMLCCILEPTSGTAKINGFDIKTQKAQVRKSIGIVFQQPSVDELLTAKENLELHCMLYGVEQGVRQKRIAEAFSLVELEDRENDLVKTYSGGMRKRLEIARALIHRPSVLFLDEPTTGLDPQTREHMWSYIERLAAEVQMTVVLTTHYMEEADALSDRVCIIDHGKEIALDTPESLKAQMGGDIVYVQAKKIDEKKIKALKFVSSIKKQDGKFAITMKDAGKNLQKLLGKIGCVESVDVHPASLNDVFIKYTGKSIRAEEAAGDLWMKMAQAGKNE